MYSADQSHAKSHPPEETLWFAPPVLTGANADPTNPQVSIEDAREVFASLEKRHLLTRRVHSIKDETGKERVVDVFVVNRVRSKDWDKLVSKSGFWNMQASPIVYYFVGRRWAWLIVIFILGAFGTRFCQDFASDVYKHTLGNMFKRQEDAKHTNLPP